MDIAQRDDNDVGATERLIEALRKLNVELDVPTPKRYGIEEDKWNRLLPLMAEQALASGSPSNNPRIPDAASIQALYREVWG
jgi:alcohol dehydrogenase class IV